MNEFSVNRLSVMLDVDRQTMVRAKDTPADAGTERKPLFRVSTAVAALDQHRGKPDRRRKPGNGGGSDGASATALLYEQHFQREAAMRALPELEQRRETARALLPQIIKLDRMIREMGLPNGQDSEVVHLRADAMLHLLARGIEGPCEWSHDEVWMMIIVAADNDDEAAA